MTHAFSPIFRRLSAALLFTTALGATAFAQSLPDISPDTIAQDVERRYDQRTGQAEYIAQSFDPFENDRMLAGSAALRSAGEAVTIDGDIIRGGAFLDISALYTTNSSDPYDVRGYEGAVFPSGQPVGVVRYDTKTLDCSRDVREVSYDDSYYRGASYGYLAGIYRLFPRYRGHRHYGWRRGYGAHRGYGHWRRGGHYGYGHGDVRRRRGYGDDGVYRRRRGGGDVRRRRPHDGDVDRPRRRTGDVDRPRRRTGDVDRPRRRTGDVDRPRRRTGDVDRPRRRTGDVDRPRRRTGDVDRPRRRADRKANANEQPMVYRRPPNLESAVGKPHRKVKRPKRRETAPVSRPRRDVRRAGGDRNVQTPPRRVRPTSVQKPVSRPPVSRPQVVKPRPQSRPVSRPRVNRKADETFKKNDNTWRRGNKHRNFYPMVGGYTRTDVYVNSRCVKEETLTVHIPQERLDAARFDGFAVLLLDRKGQELPVFVPPNYVEGFRKAVGRNGTLPKSAWDTRPQTLPSTPSSAPSSSREPIIYGDPGVTPRSGYPQE